MRRALPIAVLAVSALLAAPSAAPSTGQTIASAFAHVLLPNLTAADAARFVEDGSAALASALGTAATGLLASSPEGHGGLDVRVESTHPLGLGVARVAFEVDVRKSFTEQFTGAAVRDGAGWQVAWSTACYLAEYHGVVCPLPPHGLAAAPIPSAPLPARFAHPSVPGLLRPTALAVEKDGSLLIADAYRDQVLLRSPSGQLSVFAGDGQVGFAGDGGRATDAELDGPSALAVASNGTVYISDTGNDRVRAVAPDGRITTLAHVKQPSGLAFSPAGVIYVATFVAVDRISANGKVTTFVRGGPPYDDITVGDKLIAFSPESLAFDGAGDLDVFSFDTKVLIEFSSTGQPLRAWPNYAEGLATAPNGSVVVAEHGATVRTLEAGRFSTLVDLADARIPGYNWPPVEPSGAFEPEGVAVAADGSIFLDTYVGDGWTNQTALARISRTGRVTLVRITTPATATLPAPGSAGWPAAVYPAPHAGCPSPAGLERFGPAARSAAIAEAKTFDTRFEAGLRASDRSWWPGIYTDWVDGYYGQGRHTVTHVGPAADDVYAAAITSACGASLVRRSLAVIVGPSAYSSQVSHLFFVDRDGHALIYRQRT